MCWIGLSLCFGNHVKPGVGARKRIPPGYGIIRPPGNVRLRDLNDARQLVPHPKLASSPFLGPAQARGYAGTLQVGVHIKIEASPNKGGKRPWRPGKCNVKCPD